MGESGGAEVVRYCTSKLLCKMECGGKRAECSPQGRRFLPPFPRYIDHNKAWTPHQSGARAKHMAAIARVTILRRYTPIAHHAHQSHFDHCLQSIPFSEKPQSSESDHDVSCPAHSRANRHKRHAKPSHQCFVSFPLTRKTSLDKNWRCGSIE